MRFFFYHFYYSVPTVNFSRAYCNSRCGVDGPLPPSLDPFFRGLVPMLTIFVTTSEAKKVAEGDVEERTRHGVLSVRLRVFPGREKVKIKHPSVLLSKAASQ